MTSQKPTDIKTQEQIWATQTGSEGISTRNEMGASTQVNPPSQLPPPTPSTLSQKKATEEMVLSELAPTRKNEEPPTEKTNHLKKLNLEPNFTSMFKIHYMIAMA